MTRFPKIVSAIALFLAFTGPGFAKVSGQPQPQQVSANSQDPNAWDAPPQGLPEVQLMGFRDGVAGVRKDFDKHRELNVNNRKEYQNPHLPPDQKDAYCDGFRLGYERGASHFISGPEQPVAVLETKVSGSARSEGPDAASNADRDAAADAATEIQRRGFQDGIALARVDLENHRWTNVNDRSEFRDLKLSPALRLQYLAAFSQGYDQFMSQQASGPLDRH
jgi:hypothetical protein